MKKLILFSTSFFVFMFMIGCKKNDTKEAIYNKINVGETLKDFLLKTETPKDGMINIQSFSQITPLVPVNQQPFDGYVGGVFYINKDDARSTTISRFKIDNMDIPYNNYPAYPGYGFQSNGNTTIVSNWMKNLFGRKIKISIEGSTSYRTSVEDTSFYVPMPISFDGDIVQTYTLNANTNHTIVWTPDTQNPNGVVFIAVVYEAERSNEENASMPDTSYIQAFLETPDNGSYTITPGQVIDLPTNSFVSVTLARGNYEVMTDPITGTQTLVYALTQSNTSSTIKVVRQ